MKLIVRNLDRETTEDELGELFQEYGSVQSCDIVLDKESGLSKGFGFVEMPKVGEAKAAMKNINNKAVGNSIVRVKKAEERPEPEACDEPENKPDEKTEVEKPAPNVWGRKTD